MEKCEKCGSTNTCISEDPLNGKFLICKKCYNSKYLGGRNDKAIEGYHKAMTNAAKNSSSKCPYCNSRNTRKIGLLGHVFALDPAAKVGKQMHCNSCGCNF